jgi:hypothetical protein
VLVNGTIMSVYLWHSSVMIWLIGLANLAGGAGLRVAPGSGTWWAARPLWLGVYLVGLVLVLALFGRFERLAGQGARRPLQLWRCIGGAIVACAGLALIALGGVAGNGLLGLRWVPLLATFAGAALLGIPPWPRRRSTGRSPG